MNWWRRLRARDKFRLDFGREVWIDGHSYVIVLFQAGGPYGDEPNITVDFEPSEKYLMDKKQIRTVRV
jgi:hypothetical protein